MFKLSRLILHNMDDSQTFTYEFSEGINYYVGKNDSGKTEFYTFLDYMFGADYQLFKRDWYKDSLLYASLHVCIDKIEFVLTRYLRDSNKNYLHYADEPCGEPLRLDEYKERINNLFTRNTECLRELRTFVGEDIGYRTFTLFNFLGENRQGIVNDFFDKCSNIKYSLKLPGILNYIFNNNLSEIEQLKKQEAEIAAQLEGLEKKVAQNEEIRARINRQLEILGIDKTFTGRNAPDILSAVENYQSMVLKKDISKKSRTIAELEAVYTSLDEQIKVQLSTEADCKSFETNAAKQKELLECLQDLIASAPPYAYLAEPIVKLLAELDQSISFSKYLIQENTTKELKKRRDRIRQQILTEESKYKIYSSTDKVQAVTLIQEYLSFYDADLSSDSVKSLRSALRTIRERIRILQNTNNPSIIDAISEDVTKLYKLSVGVSDLVEYDFSKPGFKISYIKNGNTLQPQISEANKPDDQLFKNYYTGSKARHTLIQLCGYLAFLRLLLREGKYPLIPILIIDHISEPFDAKNEKAIGCVLHGAYADLPVSDFQVFIFDDKDCSRLGITPNMAHNLVDENKSGFNPFYQASSGESETSDEE